MKQYNEELQDFPFEVVEKMLEYQEYQGYIRNIKVFESCKTAGEALKGFNWHKTEEGFKFWDKVINRKNFDLFFQKYPRKLIFEKNTAYQAETEEEAEMLRREAHRQGYTWIDGSSYLDLTNKWITWNTYPTFATCYNVINGTIDSAEYNRKVGRKIITVKEFFNLTNKTMNRFPFKLKEEQARKIISVACNGVNGWKTKLAEKWGTGLLLDGYVEISENFYKEMRKACTKDQNFLFDEIFGIDKAEIDFSILNDEDVFYLSYTDNSEHLFKGTNLLLTKSVNISNKHESAYYKYDSSFFKADITKLRKTTKEEQDIYYRYYPKWSLKDAKDGEPVWVRNISNSLWHLRYATGSGQIYNDQKKSGDSTQLWNYIMKFDPSNLPVNK